MKNYLLIAAGFLVLLSAPDAKAQDSRAYAKQDVPLSHSLEAKNPGDSWDEIKKAGDHFPPSPRSETSGSLPEGDPRTKYIESWLIATADKAHQFYTKYPDDTNAAAAKIKELDVLYEAFDETYSTNLFPRIFALANAIARDTKIDKTNRFNVCCSTFIITVAKRNMLPAGIDVGAELQIDADTAERDFQDLGEVSVLSLIAMDIKAEKSRPAFREFSASLQKMADAPDTRGYVFRALADVLSGQKNAIGQTLTLEFTNFTGQVVKTTEMRGKVVVVDFWAGSYPESINNVLQLEKLYKKLRSTGLEIIGVNVDHDPDTLKKFVSEYKIEWPQYWDGKEMENKIVQSTRVTRAGTILLVDKKGRLRDFHGDEDLNQKIKALLNE